MANPSQLDDATLKKLEAHMRANATILKGPIDRPRFAKALTKIYSMANLEAPEVVFADSPADMTSKALTLNSLGFITPEQWQDIEKKAGVSSQRTDEYVHYKVTGEAPLDGDLAQVDILVEALLVEYKSEIDNLRYYLSSDFLYSYWLQGSLAYAEACIAHDIDVDMESVELLRDFGQMISCAIVYDGVAIVSENPVEVHWDAENECLNNPKGPAIRYKDDFSVWAIGGVIVDEQIVMRPETQTLEQINSEEDQEVKRLRITGYGWDKYCQEMNATVLDVKTVQLPNTNSMWMESLMGLENMKVLFTYDPSTGRPYALEVDPRCNTCEEAQEYLASPGEALEGCSFRPSSIYPVLRT
jgi:hypothetical protein